MSPPVSLPLRHALARCRLAHASDVPQLLATHAQIAITADPSSAEAWTHLAHALYALHRVEHAIQAIRTALILSPTLLRLDLFHACALQIRILQKTPSPTTRLAAGWYKTHLQNCISRDKVLAYPTVAQLFVDPSLAKLSLSDCAIVTRRSGDYTKPWGNFSSRDGNCREEFVPTSILSGFPLDQTAGGYIFTKQDVVSFGCGCYDESSAPCPECIDEEVDTPVPVFRFPKINLALPEGTQILGGPLLGVHVINGLVAKRIRHILATELRRLGELRPDSPVPKYHNIIDPNIGAVDGLWVPTEFEVRQIPTEEALRVVESAIRKCTSRAAIPRDILNHIHEASGSPTYARCGICSRIPDLDPYKFSALYLAIENVLNAALPLLANLQLPALLLPGPLQVVLKAQRIVLNENDSYEGIWHDDGLREHVVAIVLYYYGVSSCLEGGGMEIASKRRICMQVGDAGAYNFDVDGVRTAIGDMYRCIVPITEGTMLVFNNYAAVHRVLPMLAKGGSGSRDFLAFFIIDQRSPLPMPETLGPRKERISRRADMLREQLEARGYFGMDGSQVCSAGNGTVSDLTWISSGEVFPAEADTLWDCDDDFEASLAIVSRLNMIPPVIGRGSSFLTSMDLPEVQFNPASQWMLHILRVEPRLQAFVDTEEMVYASAVPENEGIRAVRIYDKVEQWLELGFCTTENQLRERIVSEVQNGSQSDAQE